MQGNRLKRLKILHKPLVFLGDIPVFECSRCGGRGLKKAVAGLPEKTGMFPKQRDFFGTDSIKGHFPD